MDRFLNVDMDGFLNVDMYGNDLNLVLNSISDKLFDGSYETFLALDTESDGIHEHGGIGEISYPRPQIGVKMSTLDRLGYPDIDKSNEERLFLRSHEVSCQLYDVYKSLFDNGRDRLLKSISDLALDFGVDEITESSLVHVQRTAPANRLRLIYGVGGL